MSDSMQKPSVELPNAIDGDTAVEKLLRECIWRPATLQNDWRVFVIVGREGSGKSLTCASILQAVDPGFGVDNVHFDAVEFFEDIARDCETPGQAAMLDEAGVAFGNRTWHDREQVEANQALQTARDDNRIIGLTLPRFNELDVQLKGRIHLLLETSNIKDGDWVEVRPYVVDPTRKGRDKLYKKHPKLWVGGRMVKITSVKIGLPTDELIAEYEPKKAEFKSELYDDVIDKFNEGEDSDGGGKPDGPKDIAEDILSNNSVEEYVSEANGREYIDRQLIELEYEIGTRKGKKVKKALQQEVTV